MVTKYPKDKALEFDDFNHLLLDNYSAECIDNLMYKFQIYLCISNCPAKDLIIYHDLLMAIKANECGSGMEMSKRINKHLDDNFKERDIYDKTKKIESFLKSMADSCGYSYKKYGDGYYLFYTRDLIEMIMYALDEKIREKTEVEKKEKISKLEQLRAEAEKLEKEVGDMK